MLILALEIDFEHHALDRRAFPAKPPLNLKIRAKETRVMLQFAGSGYSRMKPLALGALAFVTMRIEHVPAPICKHDGLFVVTNRHRTD